jgi:hypothetical protein
MNTTTVTTVRIRCAHCKATHDSIAKVRDCAEWELYVSSGQAEADARAEIAAEAAAERYFESGSESFQMLSQWELQEDMARSPFDPVWQV